MADSATHCKTLIENISFWLFSLSFCFVRQVAVDFYKNCWYTEIPSYQILHIILEKTCGISQLTWMQMSGQKDGA